MHSSPMIRVHFSCSGHHGLHVPLRTALCLPRKAIIKVYLPLDAEFRGCTEPLQQEGKPTTALKFEEQIQVPRVSLSARCFRRTIGQPENSHSGILVWLT